ncbi:predicted protein [Nematostella vectensis]|uniref:Endoplasmic reticulum-Golgi intermediate compartment protein 1 n=1 Tax=Nematostella vectensis TaxID=45351 RepID=A7RGX6_NEMVE|nr:endoplasmic reticulum-Golgi intermediate compartment protein 1 [Nematostella vectensis]EDO49249.1 predicted protein [Nematostella vectensis]|eukprot:XP_001641312.1 predicted protein [Nematostella vectensis]
MQFDVRRFDIYRKVPKDLTEPTFAGAVISICSCLFITFLFLSEFYGFIGTEIASELFVDNPTEDDKIPVILNITLPRMKCEFPGLDIQDEMGRHEVGFKENVERREINNGEGCFISTRFTINKVPGNFHVSTHGAGKQPDSPDMNHIINAVNFGSRIMDKLPGAFTALKDRKRHDTNGLASHDYILKIVPTIYQKLDGTTTFSYQYTWAYKEYVSYSHGGQMLPAIWFRYDLSPITVKYIERRQPLYHFITTVCAIVGGTFTVAGIIDSAVFTASEMWRKHQLGKLS